MTRTRKGLIAAALAALIAPVAVVAALSTPASADADGKHRHDLDTYKREGWFEILAGQNLHEHMYCDDGDYALDGVWKIDAHDSDNTSVRADKSYRDGTLLPTPVLNKWHFNLTNTGLGRAQVKLFVTCLDGTTGERDGHTHDLTVSPAPVTTTVPIGVGSFSAAVACTGTDIPVSPGFIVDSGTARITASYPTDETTWHWEFWGDAVAGTVEVQIYCVSRDTTIADSHSHRIDADLRPKANEALPGFGRTDTVALGDYSDHRIFARAHDDGKVGAFDIADADRAFVYYLGQDAQGQARGFRFKNTGAGTETVDLAVWGFDKRTKKNS